MLHAFDFGLAKIMSKMGISVLDSYRGAHLFDILGLDSEVVERSFYGTPSPIGGIGYDQLEVALRDNWMAAQEEVSQPALVNAAVNAAHQEGQPPAASASQTATPLQPKALPDYGWVRFRKDERAEPHGWQPQTVRALQMVTGTARAPQPDRAARRRPGLPSIPRRRKAGPPFCATCSRFAPPQPRWLSSKWSRASHSASLRRVRYVAGVAQSRSAPVHYDAMNQLGARSNTGEGGEDPAVYPAGCRTGQAWLPGAPAFSTTSSK